MAPQPRRNCADPNQPRARSRFALPASFRTWQRLPGGLPLPAPPGMWTPVAAHLNRGRLAPSRHDRHPANWRHGIASRKACIDALARIRTTSDGPRSPSSSKACDAVRALPTRTKARCGMKSAPAWAREVVRQRRLRESAQQRFAHSRGAAFDPLQPPG